MSTTRAADILALRSCSRISPAAWRDLDTARAEDPDRRVRSAALTLIVERGSRARVLGALTASATDADPALRRRVGELVAAHPTPALAPTLCTLLADPDARVAEAAAAALGECPGRGGQRFETIRFLGAAATGHRDPLVREAAVAALGAIGDDEGLPAILAGCGDKPAIRRRAVLALAPFSGPDVDRAIERALQDRDWQTRQAAELLTGGETTNGSS